MDKFRGKEVVEELGVKKVEDELGVKKMADKIGVKKVVDEFGGVKMSETYEGEVFRHNKPITADDIVPRVIGGLDGSFRERSEAEGCSTTRPTVGVVVQFTEAGIITGSRMVKFGKVAPKPIASKEIWPEADEAEVVFPEFDLSDFDDFPGQMSTPYAGLGVKVCVTQGDSSKVVKVGELEAKGYSELAFRLHFRTMDTENVKFTLVALPVNVSMVKSTYTEAAGSRGFPGFKIHEGRAKLITKEEAESKFGVGVEPFYNITDAKVDDAGQIDTKDVMFPASMDIKRAVVSLLQSGVTPNVNIKRALLDEAIKGGKYKKKVNKQTWPDPLEEGGMDTSDEEELGG